VDMALAVGGLVVVVLFVGGQVREQELEHLIHRHRAHA